MKLFHFGKENEIVCKMMECQNVTVPEVEGKGTKMELMKIPQA